jgi:hypothetical protein
MSDVMCSCCRPVEGPALSTKAMRYLNNIRGLYRHQTGYQRPCGTCGELGHYSKSCPKAVSPPGR